MSSSQPDPGRVAEIVLASDSLLRALQSAERAQPLTKFECLIKVNDSRREQYGFAMQEIHRLEKLLNPHRHPFGSEARRPELGGCNWRDSTGYSQGMESLWKAHNSLIQLLGFEDLCGLL